MGNKNNINGTNAKNGLKDVDDYKKNHQTHEEWLEEWLKGLEETMEIDEDIENPDADDDIMLTLEDIEACSCHFSTIWEKSLL